MSQSGKVHSFVCKDNNLVAGALENVCHVFRHCTWIRALKHFDSEKVFLFLSIGNHIESGQLIFFRPFLLLDWNCLHASAQFSCCTLLFSLYFAFHVWAINSVDFRLAQLGACWFLPLQCFPPGSASPARFCLPDDSLCYSAAAAFAKFSANRSPNLWMPINLIDFHHTFSSIISSLPNDLFVMFYECQITKSRKCTLCIELPPS